MATVPEPDPARNANYASISVPIDISVNALSATGSFAAQRQFADVSLNVQSTPVWVDVTDAVQLKIPASILNDQLTYQTGTDDYLVDSVTISCENIDNITTADVISVGKLRSMHKDFADFINTYFGVAGGFESLYAEEQRSTDISNSVFDKAAFVELVTSTTDADTDAVTHTHVKKLTGHITVSNVSQLLKYIVDGDVFNNRAPGGATDWGLKDKFQAGDLIWCPSGIAVTLLLGLNIENMLPINNTNTALSNSGGAGNFTYSESGNTTLLTRVTNAPILFIVS